jgi:hypothetical protein
VVGDPLPGIACRHAAQQPIAHAVKRLVVKRLGGRVWACVVDVDDGLSEGLRGFLGQIVTNAAFDQPVLVLAEEFVAIRRRHRMRRTVGIAFKGDRGHGDDRSRAQLRFQIIVSLIAGRQADPLAIVVDHDRDVIRIVEGLGGALERCIVEMPFR